MATDFLSPDCKCLRIDPIRLLPRIFTGLRDRFSCGGIVWSGSAVSTSFFWDLTKRRLHVNVSSGHRSYWAGKVLNGIGGGCRNLLLLL